jgi:phenylpropionate dioxygenase-like ring-hydroxylating dioxygenase large terminal subunit
MRHERQVELLRRVAEAGDHLQGLQAPASMVHPASAYTDEARFAQERQRLFRDGPVFFSLSGAIPAAGDHLADTVGGVPLVVVRQADGSLRALVNACRHRAAPIVAPGSGGHGARSFTCPYHGWVYGTDGGLKGRPLSAGAFDDVAGECDLHRVAVAERHGMIFVRPGGTEPIDVDAFLCGAQHDLADFDLGGYHHVESRTRTWKMNWKLFLDTFTESYHIRTLHATTLLPRFNADCVIFDAFGPHCLSVGLRADVLDETRKPVGEWSLLPYGTIQYFLVPSGLVVHQLDHVEVWRVEPIDVRTSRLRTSIYAPDEPQTEKALRYWTKNLDLLLQVTGTEDFPVMEQIQASLDSGAVPELVYGRNEPPLIHYHRELDRLLGIGS